MVDANQFAVFLLAAVVIAITPGTAIMYVASRTLAGGAGEGIASAGGAALGGLVHVAACALGVSAILMASANAFLVLKLLGASYLIWLGVTMWRDAATPLSADTASVGAGKALRDGILVEILNPKVAAFFLAFIPQFVDPTRPILPQILLYGCISVLLNALVDAAVIVMAVRARRMFVERPSLIARVRQGSAAVICGLGATLLLARRIG